MFAYLKGEVVDMNPPDRLTLDVGGVGYDVFAPSRLLQELSLGGGVELWIHSHIKEDAFSLYGFADKKEREVFVSLLSINGVGPKLSLSVLSSCSMDQLSGWIANEDIQALTRLPKVGKKTAGQMILSLKDKKLFQNSFVKKDLSTTEQAVISALMRLGFRSSEIKEALSRMESPKDEASGIRLALMELENL